MKYLPRISADFFVRVWLLFQARNQIDSLQFDFKTYGSNVHKLGDIIGSSNESDVEESRERDSSYTKTNIEQDFLNDAGSIKKS